jgi:hypothetical protein
MNKSCVEVLDGAQLKLTTPQVHVNKSMKPYFNFTYDHRCASVPPNHPQPNRPPLNHPPPNHSPHNFARHASTTNTA